MLEFNFEAWVRLDVVNDLVITSHKIGDRDPTSIGAELAQLIEIERNKLLNFEDIDPVRQAGIAREALGYGKTALPGYEDRAKTSLRLSRQRSTTASPGDVVT